VDLRLGRDFQIWKGGSVKAAVKGLRAAMRQHAMTWRRAKAIAAIFKGKGVYADYRYIERQALKLAKDRRDLSHKL
jgi:hypothetical protein